MNTKLYIGQQSAELVRQGHNKLKKLQSAYRDVYCESNHASLVLCKPFPVREFSKHNRNPPGMPMHHH